MYAFPPREGRSMYDDRTTNEDGHDASSLGYRSMVSTSRRFSSVAFSAVLAGGLAGLVASAVAACVGDDPIAASVTTGDGGGGGNADGTVGPGSSGGLGDSAACASRCQDTSTLAACDGTTTACQFDCIAEGNPHCAAMYPSGAVKPEMMALPGLRAVAFTSTKANPDTGAIDNERPGNDDPLKLEVKQGIGFQLAQIDATHRIGIWVFDSLEIPLGVTVHFARSEHAAAFVAKSEAKIVGVLDVRGYNSTDTLCGTDTFASVQLVVGGPGGGTGGHLDAGAPGPGVGGQPKTSELYYIPGPGGAGFGAAGGVGGNGKDAGFEKGGSAGVVYGNGTLVPLLGGSGGAGIRGASGGGGGGAFQLVAGKKVVIGDGTNAGGINAGGCGGVGGSMGGPGGGGGSGGAVLIEAPSFDLRPNGVVAANGGSGGVGGGGAGIAGELKAAATYPPYPGGSYGPSGVGGAGTQASGGNAGAAPATGYSGGAGGGSVGRIRINNRTGSYTPPNGAVLSPSAAIASSPTSFGVLDVH